jgi:hypothetical protein
MTGKNFRVMLTAMLGLLQLSVAPQVFSYQSCIGNIDGDLRLDVGYRWDKINNRVSLFGADEARVSSQTINHVNTFLLGATGYLAYDRLFIKGQYHYGWIGNGRYDEAGFVGKIHGHTSDALAGLGYLFQIHRCIWTAPIAGWSYDNLHMTAKHVRIGLDGVVSSVGNIVCRNRFQGPWIGFDVVFQPTQSYQFVLGHEFHYAHWRGTRWLSNGELGSAFGETTGFSNTRKHNNIWGQVFRLDVTYMVCQMWDCGLGLKYQSWSSCGNGNYKRTIVPVDPTITAKRVTDVDWESFTLTLHTSYMF